MGLRINQNVAAFNSYRNLTVTDGQLSKSLEKLSSGFRINRAADDAAGLSISEKLRSQVGGFKMAIRNAQDGISVIQTAEGALGEVHAILQRVRDLALQAANVGATDQSARDALGDEVNQALSEIDRIAQATVFGNKQLLATTATLTFHVGAGTDSFNQITISFSQGTSALALSLLGTAVASLVGMVTGGNVNAVSFVDGAISTVSTQRSKFGSYQNRLEATISNLSVSVENLSASESRIRDTDMAQEMVAFTRHQILMQAGVAMLSQANSVPQTVLQLLR